MNHIRLEKKGLRGLAIAESFKESDMTSMLAGVVMRRDMIVDGFVLGRSTIEGDDATEIIVSMYERLCRDDISFILLSGLIISMYNIIDIKKIWKSIGIPVIGVTYEKSEGIEEAIRNHFPDSYSSKVESYHKIGPRMAVLLHTNHEIFVRVEGCEIREAKKLLDDFTLQGSVPEPLRVAHLLAKTCASSER